MDKLAIKVVGVTPKDYLSEVAATHTAEVKVVDLIRQNQKFGEFWSFRKGSVVDCRLTTSRQLHQNNGGNTQLHPI